MFNRSKEVPILRAHAVKVRALSGEGPGQIRYYVIRYYDINTDYSSACRCRPDPAARSTPGVSLKSRRARQRTTQRCWKHYVLPGNESSAGLIRHPDAAQVDPEGRRLVRVLLFSRRIPEHRQISGLPPNCLENVPDEPHQEEGAHTRA